MDKPPPVNQRLAALQSEGGMGPNRSAPSESSQQAPPGPSRFDSLGGMEVQREMSTTQSQQQLDHQKSDDKALRPADSSGLLHMGSTFPLAKEPKKYEEMTPEEQMARIKLLSRKAKAGYRKVGVTLVPKALADDNYDGQEDLASEFGQMYYPHGFRKIGEKVYDAIRRWFQYFESKDAVEERRLLKQYGRLGKKFMENMNETISRNIYAAFLHDLYAQKLRGTMNWIALPLIIINSVASAIAALSLTPMGAVTFLVLTIVQIVLGVVAAVLVAVQKFFQFAEKAAVHEAVKEAYFEAVSAETLLIYDLSVDEVTGMVVSSTGVPLKGDEIKKRLDRLFKAEKRLEGTPDEPVPEAVATKLQPFVRNLQRDGYAGRWNLVNFPPVLGLKSYFLDVPEMSGCCAIVKDGVIRCQLGGDCPPINHELPQDGCTVLWCGAPLCWGEGKNGKIYKTSARLTAENLERQARERAELQRQAVPKGVKRWMKKAVRKSKPKGVGEGVDNPLHSGEGGDHEEGIEVDLEAGGSSARMFPGMTYDMAREAYVDHLAALDELEEELAAVEAEERDARGYSRADYQAVLDSERFDEFLAEHYAEWQAEVAEERAAAAAGAAKPPLPPRAPAPPAPAPPPPAAVSASGGGSFHDVHEPLLPSPSGRPPARRSPRGTIAARWPSSPGASRPAATADEDDDGSDEAAGSSGVAARGGAWAPPYVRPAGVAGPVAEANDAGPSPFEIVMRPMSQDNGENNEEEESDEETVKPMSDVASEFGLLYYKRPPDQKPFRLPGERVKHAVVRWWREQPDGSKEAFTQRQEKRKVADKCKAFLKTITEAMSRNLYIAILHDLYAQQLKSAVNWISMPLIFMNSFSSVLASVSLMDLPANALTGVNLATVGINVAAAVMVAAQKFFQFAEKAALHDAIKQAHFEAYEELNTLMVELTVDPDTKVIMNTDGLPISDAVITEKLTAMAHIEKKMEGTPDEPVPESVARKLQPYVSKLQDEGYDDRLQLFRFPPVIGIKSYFLEVPEKTGCCTILCDGVVTFQWGSSCGPINHQVTQNGCELLLCGGPCLTCAAAEQLPSEARLAEDLWNKEKARPGPAQVAPEPPKDGQNPAGGPPNANGALLSAPPQQAMIALKRSRDLGAMEVKRSKELAVSDMEMLRRSREITAADGTIPAIVDPPKAMAAHNREAATLLSAEIDAVNAGGGGGGSGSVVADSGAGGALVLDLMRSNKVAPAPASAPAPAPASAMQAAPSLAAGMPAAVAEPMRLNLPNQVAGSIDFAPGALANAAAAAPPPKP